MFIIVKRARVAPPSGRRPILSCNLPDVYETREEAQKDAERRASAYPNYEHIVMQAIFMSRTIEHPVETVNL